MTIGLEKLEQNNRPHLSGRLVGKIGMVGAIGFETSNPLRSMHLVDSNKRAPCGFVLLEADFRLAAGVAWYKF